MSTVVDLEAVRKGKLLLEILQDWHRRLDEDAPTPEDLGWRPVLRDDLGRPYQWFQPRYRAIVGYVPNTPEFVYVDYSHRCVAYECTIEELIIGLETGLLPDPVAVVGALEDERDL